jgi:hypothetical protein
MNKDDMESIKKMINEPGRYDEDYLEISKKFSTMATNASSDLINMLSILKKHDKKTFDLFQLSILQGLILVFVNNIDEALCVVENLRKDIIDTEKRIHNYQEKEFGTDNIKED